MPMLVSTEPCFVDEEKKTGDVALPINDCNDDDLNCRNPMKRSELDHEVLPLFSLNSCGSSNDEMISSWLTSFLQGNQPKVNARLKTLEKHFSNTLIYEEPLCSGKYISDMLDSIAVHSVNTASPSFVGHMTSALPSFVLPVSRLMVGLNPNLVKVEISNGITALERQVIGMLHRLVFSRDDHFYNQQLHNSTVSLGTFCSGGTVANITALWIARNNLFKPSGTFEGAASDGLISGLLHYGYKGIAILVSQRGHYSLSKAADLLGVGRNNLVSIPTDENDKVDVEQMRAVATDLAKRQIRVMAIVGVAGTTETGRIDPLHDLADLAIDVGCHFHVDAAWGGAMLLSNKYRHLLAGIERADSVTVDAHKHLYSPMGAGIILFKDSTAVNAISHGANYILRRESKDIGKYTLEGSRPGMAIIVHACFRILGRQGYEQLVNLSMELARSFCRLIQNEDDFEVTTKPELSLLTYRFVPKDVRGILKSCDESTRIFWNAALDELTSNIQQKQFENGKSFVSKTCLSLSKYEGDSITVFRVVLANLLTTIAILREILAEQRQLANADNKFARKLSAHSIHAARTSHQAESGIAGDY